MGLRAGRNWFSPARAGKASVSPEAADSDGGADRKEGSSLRSTPKDSAPPHYPSSVSACDFFPPSLIPGRCWEWKVP